MPPTFGEFIHKVVGDLLKLGCIDGKQRLEMLDFIEKVLGCVRARADRHGQLKQGARTQSALPSRLDHLLQSRRENVCVGERIGSVLTARKAKKGRDSPSKAEIGGARPVRPITPHPKAADEADKGLGSSHLEGP